MKKIQTLATFLCFLLAVTFGTAQETNQLFWVHEDQVKPSMIDEYEKVSSYFVEQLKKYKIENVSWKTASMDNGKFLTITPIQKLSDLENFSFASLSDQMGEEDFLKIFQDFNKCYDHHGDYLIVLNSELSYMPDGLTADTPGENYRMWHNMQVSASEMPMMKEKLLAFKEVHSRKGSKMHYRIYQSGFGAMGDSYVAVISAKDAQDYAKKSAENELLMGEEGKMALAEVLNHVLKYEAVTGGMRSDLSYTGPMTAVDGPIENKD